MQEFHITFKLVCCRFIKPLFTLVDMGYSREQRSYLRSFHAESLSCLCITSNSLLLIKITQRKQRAIES